MDNKSKDTAANSKDILDDKQPAITNQRYSRSPQAIKSVAKPVSKISDAIKITKENNLSPSR